MRRSKRTSIKTETKELLIVHRNGTRAFEAFCDECQAQVQWLSLAETANLNGLRAREIFRLVETGKVHFRETSEGLLLICPNSLPAANGEKTKNIDFPKN